MVTPMAVISSRQILRKGYCSGALASRQKDIVEVRDSSADREDTMPDDWDERDDVVAAGSICPIPDCGALVVTYGPPDRTGRDNAKPWCEFTCPCCGIDFTVPEDELIFQSVPKEWLLARVEAA
jgi:hypothetical protein